MQGKEYILLDCRPKNSQRGDRAILYCYGAEPISINKQHTFCSERDSNVDAHGLFVEMVQKFEGRPDVRVQKVRSGKFKVVQVTGPRELKKQLPKPFVKDRRCNFSQMLDWAYPPFSKIIIADNGEHQNTGERASIEEILRLPPEAIDWELDKAGTNEYCRINTHGQATPSESGAASIFKNCAPRELVGNAAARIRGYNPAFIGSHNFYFDAMQPREKVGSFKIGVDGSDPVMRGGGGHLKKVEIAGRQVFCSLAFAHNNLWCPNNKLETVANFLGMPYTKRIDYDELELLVQKADKGNAEAIMMIEKYCQEDAETHLKLMQRLLPIAVREALAFETDVNSVCFNSKSALAKKLRDKRFFEALGALRKVTLEFQEFDIYAEKTRMLKNALNFGAERGYFTEPLIVAFPKFWKAFDRILAHEMAAAYLKQGIAKSNSPLDKIVFHRDLEVLCEEPLFDLQKWQASHDEGSATFFMGKYTRKRPEDIERDIDVFLKEFALLLDQAKVTPVNYSNRFFFLKPLQGLEFAMQTLQNSKLVEIYGTTSKLLSATGGRILATINGTAITSELDIYGRKGRRTDFERGVYADILKFITGTETEAEFINGLGQKFRDLAQGKIAKADLVYYTVAGLEPWEYSWPAQSQERIKALRRLKARKGEKVGYGYGIDSKGEHREYRASDFFRQDIKPDIKVYQQYFFGKTSKHSRNFSDGTITDLLYSIYPVMEHEKRKEFSQFLEGHGGLQAKLN